MVQLPCKYSFHWTLSPSLGRLESLAHETCGKVYDATFCMQHFIALSPRMRLNILIVYMNGGSHACSVVAQYTVFIFYS